MSVFRNHNGKPVRTTTDCRQRLAEVLSDTTTLLELLSCRDLPRARTHFRAGLLLRCRRGTTDSPYRTDGHTEAAYTARILEALEGFGGDLADLLDEGGEEARDWVERAASPLFRCVIGPLALVAG